MTMHKRWILLCAALCVAAVAQAQDTLQIMQYNLLNYGNYYNDCTTSTNNVAKKNTYLRTIVGHVKPDILCVNEMSGQTQYHQMLLNEVLNKQGNKYRKASCLNAGAYLVNMMYYNADKLVLYKQEIIQSIVRPIDVYTLYYKSADLATSRDTVFLQCFVAHLKAGRGDTNESKRASMISTAMNYIRSHPTKGNKLFMGDLNLYKSSEQAYKNLTYTYGGERYFYDPIEQEGNWSNNYAYRAYHTQSTHASNAPCFSSGGLDDRFDFIMASRELLEGIEGMQMLTHSYHALANDAKHFNKSIINAPSNHTVPYAVLQALYKNSDHLPVLAKVVVQKSEAVAEQLGNISYVRFANPVSHYLRLQIGTHSPQQLHINIYDIYAKLVKQIPSFWVRNSSTQIIDVSALPAGVYVCNICDQKGRCNAYKFVVD